MDAPLSASNFFGHAGQSDQVLSCIRPLDAASQRAAGQYGDTRPYTAHGWENPGSHAGPDNRVLRPPRRRSAPARVRPRGLISQEGHGRMTERSILSVPPTNILHARRGGRTAWSPSKWSKTLCKRRPQTAVRPNSRLRRLGHEAHVMAHGLARHEAEGLLYTDIVI